LDKDDIHTIKTGVGAKPKDWVGISPDDDVITSDGDGNAVNWGPVSSFLREAHPEIPTWVWLLGIAIVLAIILCIASGACVFAAVVGGLGYATALLAIGLLKSAGVVDSGGEATAATDELNQSSDDTTGVT
jgi:hypothetical protein